MKQNIFIAALLAAMLAIAGCGGGSSSSTPPPPPPNNDDLGAAAQAISTAIADCPDAACVDGEIAKAEADGSGVSAEELATLKTAAEDRKIAIASADSSLSESELAAAFQLADGLAGSEALQLGSFEIDTQTAMPTSSADWKDQATANLPLRWEGKGWRDPNPEGSDGEEEDMRVWTQNGLYISEKYDVFFATTGRAGASGAADANGVISLINLTDTAITEEVRNVLPSFFFRRGFTYKALFNTQNDGNPSNDEPAWILEGRYHGVPGVFVCGTTVCNQQLDGSGGFLADTDKEKPSATLFDSDGKLRQSTVNQITFIPSSFDKDETDVPALFAKKQNPNFLNFGVYWTTVINDGEVTAIRVDPFAGGGTEFGDTHLIVDSGTGKLTATYKGVAAGTFVTTKIDPETNDEDPTGYGGFSADANFTAVFSDDKDTLSGTIENFRKRADQAGKGDPVATWKVELSGDIKAGSVEEDNFHAQFYGETTGKRQSNGHGYAPYGLVGTFEESIEHATEGGHVAGSFGAECRGTNCSANN